MIGETLGAGAFRVTLEGFEDLDGLLADVGPTGSVRGKTASRMRVLGKVLAFAVIPWRARTIFDDI